MIASEIDPRHMARTLELALRGEGHVEPNPMVGCVVAHGPQIVGKGWHREFGGPHAEVEALREAGDKARGATLFVTLEPCCHQGKTPPCTELLIRCGLRRVVIAMRDPFPQVDGSGIAKLREAGICVDVGLLEDRARRLTAPYRKLIETARPWIIAKWAMSLDGKMATRSGASQWISGPDTRQIVHSLRGRMDAILVGLRTASLDNPLLTARPPGPRVATRIVVDSHASLAPDSQLVRTIDQAPLIVAVAEDAPAERLRRLAEAGAEMLRCPGATHQQRLATLLDQLGRRRMTNLLVEGGGQLLGSLFDLGQIDELHVFIAAKLIGGRDASVPLSGTGAATLAAAWQLEDLSVQRLANDVYVAGRVAQPGAKPPLGKDAQTRDAPLAP
jgi:diaminohydroxyphosphoribosylaminopyrimidine deaminase/5-amino-6-(5-phosphoribosylamino)uracil reductase